MAYEIGDVRLCPRFLVTPNVYIKHASSSAVRERASGVKHASCVLYDMRYVLVDSTCMKDLNAAKNDPEPDPNYLNSRLQSK